jgi:hypothetical protein
MQSFVEWENYQLKKSQNWAKQNLISVKKTGVISIFVILVAGFHLYVLFSVAEDSKTQTYHLCKVFYCAHSTSDFILFLFFKNIPVYFNNFVDK